MSRNQWILAALLLFQALLLAVAYAPWSGEAGAAGPQPLLPALASITPMRLEISDAEGQQAVLRREGERWGLEAYDGYPADASKVRELLDKLRELRVQRPVVTTGRYHEALKVAEKTFERRLRLWEDPSAEAKVEVYFGTSPSYNVIHARRAGDKEVYEARGLSAFDLRTSGASWIDKKLVDIPFEDVRAVRLRNASGTFEIRRSGSEAAWEIAGGAPKGKKLDASKVDSWVRGVCSLWLLDPAGKADAGRHGLAPPAGELEITYRIASEEKQAEREAGEGEGQTPGTGAGEQAAPSGESEAARQQATAAEEKTATVVVRVGAEAEGGEGKRYATRSEFDYAVVLSKYDAEKIIAKRLGDLLEG